MAAMTRDRGARKRCRLVGAFLLFSFFFPNDELTTFWMGGGCRLAYTFCSQG